MEKKWRLILDGKCDGYHNMSVDEAILLSYSSSKIPTLRVYGWNKPFISLGYNQDVKEIFASQNDIPFVRRITGGAAILHDRELTYSITCSLEDLNFPRGIKESYQFLCSFLKSFYKKLGVEAKFAKDVFLTRVGSYGNFCFSTCEHFDLVVDSKKIGGNAQRRKKNIIFQHGSIPQNVDFEAIRRTMKGVGELENKVTFLEDILKESTDFNILATILAESFEATFEVKFIKEILSDGEIETAQHLLKNKYRNSEWNFCRNLAGV
ncbi:MAG: biotin/lipoate A/B protein ligase family protein [Candidatus Omnitrophota bacterium]|nr:biotin/lipoate A/B protein ligase family protein [Candidatus Omnitrophota bacterium]